MGSIIAFGVVFVILGVKDLNNAFSKLLEGEDDE